MTEEEKKKKAAQDAAIAAAVGLGANIGYGGAFTGFKLPSYNTEGGDAESGVDKSQNWYRTEALPEPYIEKGMHFADAVYKSTYAALNPTDVTGGTGGEQPPITYDEGSKTVFQLIEEQKNASYAAAQAQRERAIIDAKTSYAQNLATYGKNAEALAGSGLAGGGYGEYLGASAYAQQRADIQAAKAAESAAKNTADRVYYADMAAQTEKANAAYLHLLDLAKDGGYTAEEIRSMAQKQGITSEEDLGMLGKTVTNTNISNITADTSDEEIASMIEKGEIGAESEQAARETRAEKALDAVEQYINDGDISGGEAAMDKYYNSGVVTQNDYQEFYLQKNLSSIEGDIASGKLTLKNVNIYEQALEKAKNEGKISNADFEAAKKYLYGSLATVVDGKATVVDGKNITIKRSNELNTDEDKRLYDIEVNGEKISKIKLGKSQVSAEIKNVLGAVAGTNSAKGATVLYGGSVYINIGANRWYELPQAAGLPANKRVYDIVYDLMKNDPTLIIDRMVRPEHKADE